MLTGKEVDRRSTTKSEFSWFRISKTKMEGEVCMYQKFGYCKYKESCLKRHLQETCQDSSACSSKMSCQKRHPKGCKRFAIEGFCIFGAGCAYRHQEHQTVNSKHGKDYA